MAIIFALKRCTKCGVEKEDKEFYKENRGKEGLKVACKECYIKKTSNYKKTAKGKKTQSKYDRSAKGKKVHLNYERSVKGKKNQSKYDRSAKGKKRNSNFMKSEKGKIVAARKDAKRNRDLGFVPINKLFPNSNGHHLNETYVMYIPVSLHRRFSHNHKKLQTMELINDAAVKWYYSLT